MRKIVNTKNQRQLNILLIMPDGKINKFSIGSFGISFREAPLTLTHLAALIPEHIDARVDIVDRSIGTPVRYSPEYDIVGISIMTGTAPEGYKIADRFRRMGVPVVLGGVHATLRPEEAALHADAVLTGFAEITWPRLLEDFIGGNLKSRYSQPEGAQDLRGLPRPLRKLQRPLGYMIPNTVMATRGCRGCCGFCSVPAAGFGWTKRPVEDVIEEIRDIPSTRFAISDVHLTDDPEYAKELLAGLIPLNKKWGALASTRVTEDPELLDLLQKSGCSYLLLGFESFNADSLSHIHKGFNRVSNYKTVIDVLHQYKISVQGCFIFGFDEDDAHTFANTVDLVNEIKVDIPRYALYTPYPGTKAFEGLMSEQRLLHTDWSYYDTQHVVFAPKKMSPLELDRGLLYAYEETFKILSSLKRAKHSGGPGYITFVGNLAYKLYIMRLKHDSNRFPAHISAAELLTGAV